MQQAVEVAYRQANGVIIRYVTLYSASGLLLIARYSWTHLLRRSLSGPAFVRDQIASWLASYQAEQLDEMKSCDDRIHKRRGPCLHAGA